VKNTTEGMNDGRATSVSKSDAVKTHCRMLTRGRLCRNVSELGAVCLYCTVWIEK